MSNEQTRVVVVDLDIPFGSMVALMVRVVLASIPAALIVLALAVLVGMVFGTLNLLL